MSARLTSTHAAVPTFSMAERDRRWNLARTFMRREGVDALLVFGEHEDTSAAPVTYDTQFTNGRPGTTVIFPKAGEPVSLFGMALYALDHLESLRRGYVVWIPPQNTRISRNSATIADTLNELGLTTGTIGVVGLEPYSPQHPKGIVPYNIWNNILKQFPHVNFKPVAYAFTELIMPQSEEEIAVLRHTASIGEAMVQAMVNKAAPGVSEIEVFAAGMAEGFSRGGMPAAMHFWSGPDPVATGLPAWGYRPQAPRILQDGDVITGELFSNFGGRATQHQILIAIGEVHEDFERAASVARAVYNAGVHALRPGRKFGDVVEEMLKPTENAGGWIMGPAVHGLNPLVALSRFPGDFSQLRGAEAYFGSVSGLATILDDMKLEPGMSFAFEPNYAFGRHVVHIGTTVIVGEDEPIELNPYSSQILRAAGTSPS